MYLKFLKREEESGLGTGIQIVDNKELMMVFEGNVAFYSRVKRLSRTVTLANSKFY